ncbi:MAG: radical SAM family heme chaperone HemW [Clostridia bacterium]|nr:radical SAM family heme chaperone HemW [Clostridia bacterium]
MSFDLIPKKRLGLYVHIPFCLSKCAYCDFNSAVPENDEFMGRYVSAVITHMNNYRDAAKEYEVDTVFIGGGTPTALPKAELIRLIKAIKKTFNLTRYAEFTVEANPATVTLPLLKQLRRIGVNRLSFGMQSANNRELKALSRRHTRQEFIESYRLARRAGFDNINVDVMFGIPYQTFDSLMKTLDFVTRLSPEHISMYNLKIEPGTPFYKNLKAVREVCADEDTEYAMYTEAIEFLERRGYPQYEISNFARHGFPCIHNLKYWNCEEYLGFGVSAHSYFNGNRFSFISDVKKYMEALEDIETDIPLTDEFDPVESRERMGEYIMLRMRLVDGLDPRAFAAKFGVSFEETYGAKLKKYLQGGFMVRYNNGCYALTPGGMFVSNYILSDILEFDDLCSYSGSF